MKKIAEMQKKSADMQENHFRSHQVLKENPAKYREQ
jgi:hypothetical protein